MLALLLAAVMVLSLAACGGSAKPAETQAPAAGSTATAATAAPAEPISLTLWGAEEDQSLLADLVEKFKAQYSGQTFDIKIGVESESTAKDTVLTDVEAAADVFAFANDQLNDLVAAGALLALDGDIAQVLPAYAGKTILIPAISATAKTKTRIRSLRMRFRFRTFLLFPSASNSASSPSAGTAGEMRLS